jgi:glycosyltransferase involved in cell wall biosynthesis
VTARDERVPAPQAEPARSVPSPAPAPTVDVVVPVHDEERDLARSVERLVTYVRLLPFTFRVTIADNASSDGTALVAQRLAHRFDEVVAVHLPDKGRGRALRHTWLRSASPVVAYMDVDLSTDLNAVLPLVAPLLSGHSDLAIGSRLSRGARVRRGHKRELISRCYNVLLHVTLRTRFADAQCGFKALRRDAARALVPMVRDDGWFFDTELLVLAERAGLRIHEVPVDWVDDPTSTVDIVRTAWQDLCGIARLGRSLLTRQLPLDRVRHARCRWLVELDRTASPPQSVHHPWDGGSSAPATPLAHDHAYSPSSDA